MATRTTVNRRQYRSGNNRNYRDGAYVGGSAAPQIDVRTAIHEEPIKRVSNTTRKNREKAAHMNLGYVAFLVAALCLTMGVLYGYITLQAGNTAMVEEIAALESQLNSLKLDNDEEYSRIMSTVDMEHVKEVAMGELGMQYAEEGQIIEVEGNGDDYVRQYENMP